MNITKLFLEQEYLQPDSICISKDQTQLTFKELKKMSLNVAHHIIKYVNSDEDQCIGIYFEPSIELMVGIWGTLFSGNGYLPLSTEYPTSRLQYMVTNSGCKVILTSEKLIEDIEKKIKGVQIIAIDKLSILPMNLDYEYFKNRTDRNLAYLIYTSGSTGNPKGVVIEDKAIVNQMNWLRKTYEINNTATILQKTPISFDAAQWELLAIACGAKVVLGEEGVYKDPQRIIDLIKLNNVTTLQCVPTLLKALLQNNNFSSCDSLNQLFCGGEALSMKLAIKFKTILPKCQLINLYGPTECTINATSYKITLDNIDENSESVPIGFPVENTKLFILNDQLIQVKKGEKGELFIGGIQLARGYKNNPKETEDKFINNPINSENEEFPKLYKTGDIVLQNEDGSLTFMGRKDNQIKIRGYRVELDEIKCSIENHNWVKNAFLSVKQNPRTNSENLVAVVELDAKEAFLMDQGSHGTHHETKKNKLQVLFQLSNKGCRSYDKNNILVDLPNKNATKSQEDLAFNRKTYRFFEGTPINKRDILDLLKTLNQEENSYSRSIESLTLDDIGSIMRYFGQFKSYERLLPKYTYASPGALYATQIYLEIHNILSIKSGIYYFHPINHQLEFINDCPKESSAMLKIHFNGKRSAIQPVYKNNVLEVLEMEVGHIVGVFERILPNYGLYIDGGDYISNVKDLLKCNSKDYYLGTFNIIENSGNRQKKENNVDIYIQSNRDNVIGLPKGTYKYENDTLELISDSIISRNEVIAINQEIYDRASFGISIVSNNNAREWESFILLGKNLQLLQMNSLCIGLMSSGYSSKTNNNLPSANKLIEILKPFSDNYFTQSYFCIGGSISYEQLHSRGMKEDSVHTKGVKEILMKDLNNTLPHYMVPNILIIERNLSYTPNGKIDSKSIDLVIENYLKKCSSEFVPPTTRTERAIANIVKEVTGIEELSLTEDFFELGVNSLTAVALIAKINEYFNIKLPVQVLFESPTVEKLSVKINENCKESTRIIPLQNKGNDNPIFCWPGLGGYPMNLKHLAINMGEFHPFYGIQAYGLNDGEVPYGNITEMAKKDVEEIIALNPNGPYNLFGFSFGARVAFEACYLLEKSNRKINNLILIAPGSPKLWSQNNNATINNSTFDNKAFVTVLYSVFSANINDSDLLICLKVTKSEDDFVNFVNNKFKQIPKQLIRKIIEVVKLTYEFKYSFKEFNERKINAPITILKAKGDDYSFIENSSSFDFNTPNIITLEGDHYNILKPPHLFELTQNIHKIIMNQNKVTIY